jgi:hypothetical protein
MNFSNLQVYKRVIITKGIKTLAHKSWRYVAWWLGAIQPLILEKIVCIRYV